MYTSEPAGWAQALAQEFNSCEPLATLLSESVSLAAEQEWIIPAPQACCGA